MVWRGKGPEELSGPLSGSLGRLPDLRWGRGEILVCLSSARHRLADLHQVGTEKRAAVFRRFATKKGRWQSLIFRAAVGVIPSPIKRPESRRTGERPDKERHPYARARC